MGRIPGGLFVADPPDNQPGARGSGLAREQRGCARRTPRNPHPLRRGAIGVLTSLVDKGEFPDYNIVSARTALRPDRLPWFLLAPRCLIELALLPKEGGLFMPARAERIHLFVSDPHQADRTMDFPLWWDRRAFFEKYGGRQIDTGHPLYVDYALLLTAEEARAWDGRCRENFSADPASKRPHMVSAMERLASALKSAKWVVVESYEWESGLE